MTYVLVLQKSTLLILWRLENGNPPLTKTDCIWVRTNEYEGIRQRNEKRRTNDREQRH